MAGRIQDKVAVITGGGDGIGQAVARRFAQEGAKLVIAELDPAKGEAIAAELSDAFGTDAAFIATDVGKKEDNLAMIELALERFGSVDILVNNAWGGGNLSRVEFKSDATMQHGLHVGFLGPFWAMQAAFPAMKANGWGRVVNMCSLNGVNAHMGSLEYNTSKEALRTLTRTAAREWAKTGVTCNVICPGAKTASARALEAIQPKLIQGAEAMIPMGRMGDAEADIAPVALFLASDEARYVTGNTLFVDGGSHSNGANWAPDLPDGPV